VRDAEQQLRRADLTIKLGKKQQTDSVQPDTVLKQEPEAYKRLMRGCPVEVTIAVPIPLVQVPNFIGRPTDEVITRLRFGQLRLGTVREVEGESATVVDQDPKPGSMVPRGTPVNLVVVRAEPPVVVPNLIERSLRDAAEILKGLGLGYRVVEGDTSESTVIRQEPRVGTRVPRGTVIRLWFPIGE
jgi:serine/threonine-protein kinase